MMEISHITFTADNKPVLDNLNFQEGEIYALIGTNGTGKSTLARLVMRCQGYNIRSGGVIFTQQRIESILYRTHESWYLHGLAGACLF